MGRREKLGAVWSGREDPSGRLNDARGCQTAHAQTTRGQTVEFLGRDNSSRGDGISRCRLARENAPCCTAAAGAVAVKSIVKQTTNRMGSGEQLMEHWSLFRHGRCEGEAPKIEGTSAGPPARAETPISARTGVRSFRPHPQIQRQRGYTSPAALNTASIRYGRSASVKSASRATSAAGCSPSSSLASHPCRRRSFRSLLLVSANPHSLPLATVRALPPPALIHHESAPRARAVLHRPAVVCRSRPSSVIEHARAHLAADQPVLVCFKELVSVDPPPLTTSILQGRERRALVYLRHQHRHSRPEPTTPTCHRSIRSMAHPP